MDSPTTIIGTTDQFACSFKVAEAYPVTIRCKHGAQIVIHADGSILGDPDALEDALQVENRLTDHTLRIVLALVVAEAKRQRGEPVGVGA